MGRKKSLDGGNSQFTWIEPQNLRLSTEEAKHYSGITIQRGNEEPFSVVVGSVVLLRSLDTVPYIAMVDELFEDKSGTKMCKTTWFYRYNYSFPLSIDSVHNLYILSRRCRDVNKLSSDLLSKLPLVAKDELFFSKDSDINRVDFILKPCTVHFIHADRRVAHMDHTVKFVCSYFFNAVTLTTRKLSESHVAKLQSGPALELTPSTAPEDPSASKRETVTF